MVELEQFVPSLVCTHLGEQERDYLRSVFDRCNGYPSLQQLWQLVDEPWQELGCDPSQLDERVTAFYNHPVWLLNGLFIEQDQQSLANRQIFTDWIKSKKPLRVADYGGGFGGLARMIGAVLPDTNVEVVEPHPHQAAIALAANTSNVRFVPELTGSYDLLIATDVFEHVPDPIGLAAATAKHLSTGGYYLIANCFAPVVKCHLPQLFHFNLSWSFAMHHLGLKANGTVSYATVFLRQDIGSIEKARSLAIRSNRFYDLTSRLPLVASKIVRYGFVISQRLIP